MAGNNDDGDEEWRRCDLCDKTFETKNQSIVHCRGIVHLERTLADERGEDYEQLAEEKKKREGKPEIPKTDAIVLDSMRLDMMDGWDRKSKFYCQVCETDCISEAGYDSHVKGAKHKKRELSQSKFLKGDEDQTATAEANFALLAQPIIGLELIQEVKSRSGDALDYNCHLCGNASLTLFTISSHVISVKHRKKYFQLRHPTVWNKVVAAGKKNANVACQRYAQEVEEEFGRKKIVRVGEEFKETVPDLPPDAEEMVEDTPMAWDQLGDYVCEVCEITCNGENSWNLHVKGAKHKKRALEKAKPGGRLTGKTDAIEANFDTLKEPIIGLEYIEAFQFLDEFHNEERYNCHICTINTLTCDTINAHVISVKHRRRYIKLKYPSFHKGRFQD